MKWKADMRHEEKMPDGFWAVPFISSVNMQHYFVSDHNRRLPLYSTICRSHLNKFMIAEDIGREGKTRCTICAEFAKD